MDPSERLWVTPPDPAAETTRELGFLRRAPELAPGGAEGCVVAFLPNGQEALRIILWEREMPEWLEERMAERNGL